MKKLSLPKKYERDKQLPYFYNDTWITNGQFLCKRELIKDDFKYCKPSPNNRDDIERVIPLEQGKRFIKTDKLYDDNSTYLRIFICEESQETICFRDDYISFFNIDFLFGQQGYPFITENRDIILMPFRHYSSKLCS